MERPQKKRYALSPQKKALLTTLLKQKGVSTSHASMGHPSSSAPIRRTDPSSRPLSFAQQRLWFLDQLDPGNTTYTIPLAFSLQGQLNISALTQSLHALLQRHEVLRCSITTEAGTPTQHLASLPTPLLPLIDLSHISSPLQEQNTQQLIDAEARKAFELAHGPLIRFHLLRLHEQTHILLVTIHHIVFDGWSAQVMSYEIATLYNTSVAGNPILLPDLSLQYADYAVWQQAWLSGERKRQQLAYWQEHLADLPPPLELLLDYPRPVSQTFSGALSDFHLPAQTVVALQTICQQTDTTLFMLLLTAFEILLFRYSGQTDFVVGTPVANRASSEVEGLIGLFVNTLPLRADLSGKPTCIEVLQRVRTTALNGYSYQDIPFEQIVEALQIPRDISHPPLFQVLFSLTHAVPAQALHLSGLQVESIRSYTHTAKVDLTLFLEETGQGLQGSLEYNTDLFTPETMRRLSEHYKYILQALPAALQQPITHIPLIPPAAQLQHQQAGIAARVSVGTESIHAAFEAQVARTPAQIALTYHQENLTYAQLNLLSNQLAHQFIQQGIGPGQFVGICVRRSLPLVVGILGIVKSGAAYVPLDPASPLERIAFLLADTRAAALVTQSVLDTPLPAYTGLILHLDELPTERSRIELANPAPRGMLDDIAYIIYTSGSTGQPKGVMVSRRNLLNTFAAVEQFLQPQPSACWLAVTNFAFDISVLELLWTFTRGFHVIIQDEIGSTTQNDDASLATQLKRYAVTHLQGTPALAQLLLADASTREALRGLDYLILGGETFSSSLAMDLQQLLPDTKLINGYGPTETTIYATLWSIEAVTQRIPIGRPLINTTTYILDAYGNSVPAGMPGELFIGGAGVTTGYLQRPDLTAERFVPDPFSQQPGSRLYRTGDRVRDRSDGILEYLGRLDHQVKLNGYRIEPGEIEAQLKQNPFVRESVVLLREDRPGEKRLVAYHVGEEVSSQALQRFLSTRLPAYLCPSHFIHLAAFPLTANGKINRRALPAPVSSDHTLYVPQEQQTSMPRSSVEIQLLQIWERLLQVHPIAVTDDFFALGGHSLLAVRLLAQVQATFSVELPLSILFQAPTIERMAEALQQKMHTRTALVALQIAGSACPFFCIHPIGGEVFCYVQLAHHLGTTRPIYALQMPSLASEQTYIPLEQLAAHYIAALQQIQPAGPYLLGGWSLGGIIAFEMAQQLSRQQQSTALLCLIDSDAPALHQSTPMHATQAVTSFAQDLSATCGVPLAPPALHGDQLSQQQQLIALLEQIQQAQIVPPGTGLTQLEQLFRAFQSNLRAVQQYTPQPYTGPVAFFNAADRPGNTDQTQQRGWKSLISPACSSSYQFTGTHYTLLQPPYVAALAQQLGSSLAQAFTWTNP